jgi:hypothetical protein
MAHRQAHDVNSGEAGHSLQSRARDKREKNLKLGVVLPVTVGLSVTVYSKKGGSSLGI